MGTHWWYWLLAWYAFGVLHALGVELRAWFRYSWESITVGTVAGILLWRALAGPIPFLLDVLDYICSMKWANIELLPAREKRKP